MDPAIRRQLLADLGIVPWQLRTGPGDGRERPHPDPEPRPAREARAVVEEPAATSVRDARKAAEPPPPTPVATAAQPFSVLSLVSGVTLMLVDGDCSRRDLRLAMDILGAAGGDPGRRPRRRRFDWPPPGTLPELAGAEAGERALGAFVDKDLEDHGAKLLLCTAAVAQRLPALRLELPTHELPDLAALGQAPEAKRALWATLRQVPR